ncbi:hypothetical protein MpV1_122c [Micromonas sp. RCC1109 virus MpV1]|uniref:hypothetical protein n=1 Tax=Micromonas sp. RCC1109 virus MpV1 TaxID=880161 RepID=UPI0001EF44F3|nr:hypothetical protein MpV1_122c [Micromonas sp. RCC1109 virus MpV1]ADQ91045.1 hypothetical protein MpV1_122c [Micromonas sp. RCC1109 virus MpV1]
MENCDVCCEKLNKINHKKVKCPFCDLTSCRTCSQRYILESFEDPHCMGCKTLWNREFVDSFCTKYFRNTELKRHRENVLFERERARMPETQPEVERIQHMRRLRRIIRQQKEDLIELHHRYRTFEVEIPLPPEIRTLYREMENTYRHLEELRNGGTFIDNEPRKFVRQCPVEECKGFLNEEWYCGLCTRKYCKDCNELLVPGHECDPETVKTMKLLNKDSKSCPKCGTVIHKTSGCAQMWCISCHTAFNWRTGEIETGRIHNPHFIEFKKKTMMSREHGDIPCGGVPSFRELREIGATNEILQYAMIVHQMERENMYIDLTPIDNMNLRVAYMLNDIDEDDFKNFLQRQEKFKDKSRDLSNIYEMMANTGGDLLRQYVIDPERHDEIVDLLKKIVDYGNEIFETIRKRYNCRLPRNIYI